MIKTVLNNTRRIKKHEEKNMSGVIPHTEEKRG